MSEHNHSHNCGCGGHHHGHHHHEHDHHGGCCGKHKNPKLEDLNDHEIHFLNHLLGYKFMPVTRFVVKSSKESDFENVVLEPVFVVEESDTMEFVKNFGNKLQKLENLGFLTLDYDIPLDGYNYNEYHNSEIFAYFKNTVEEAKGKDGFLGDIPEIECGSIAPTEKCIELLGK